jgi:peptide subunit release factor 1 (eRF1)
VWALDEYEQYGVVLFGQDQARALRIYLGAPHADVMVEPDQTWSRAKGRPTHYTQYDRRQREFDQRYLRMLANRINQYFISNEDLARIIFGGNVQMGHAVRSLLHPSVAEAVIAILPIPFTAKEHEVPGAIQDVAIQYEREHEVAVVDELIRSARLDQRGVLGLEAVTRALDLHAVRLLVLPYPVQTVLAEKLLMRAAQSSSDVEFVSGEAATRLNEAGGVGALLYYGLPSGSV